MALNIQPNSFRGGYTPQTAETLIGDSSIFALVGQGLVQVPKFDNHKPVPGTVDHTELEIYVSGVGADKVKLPADYELPTIDDLTEIKLVNAVGYIDYRSHKGYLRADGIQVTK